MFKSFNINVLIFSCLVAVIVSLPDIACAAPFDSLIEAGNEIFKGLRKIIYPASAIGIITICMGGFFGNINWKWLTAIVVGLIVISCCVAFLEIFAPADAASHVADDIMNGR